MQKKQWHIFPPQPKTAELAADLKISPLLAQLLCNRQIQTPEQAKVFLNPKLSDLIEPEQMPGIGPAVERIEKAIKAKEKITIYGD
jgi:single-stranded-DNA-specific exonuclease